MPYRILRDGVIECDTAAEVQALAGGMVGNGAVASEAPVKGKKRGRKKGRKNPVVKAMWAKAKRLAKKEGISVGAARSKLAKAK